jgi:hypothetical protein
MNEIQEMSFIPRDLITVMVGCHSTTCYPKVEAKMPIHKRAFAYQVALSALESLPIDIRLIIKAMATQLNCNATADGLMYDWKSVLDEGWYNPELLQVLSFHNSAGIEIADTTTIADASNLLPVVNGLLATCRKPDAIGDSQLCFLRFDSIRTQPCACWMAALTITGKPTGFYNRIYKGMAFLFVN